MNYITVIKYGTIAFPIVSFLFTLPFILHEYHKYGSISFFKSLIIYLFIYYIICAYFLVILPLPKISEVKNLTTPMMQLIPFSFVIDFIKHSSLVITNPNTYIIALKESYFYVPIFNIFLTIPFGMFLRYYFKCSLKRTIKYTFLLSLFFELTQLTGLYFIYPRGYRLFDLDDLILNTLGGIVGYLLCGPITKIIPEIDEVKRNAKEKGKTISGPRRTLATFIDIFIIILTELLFEILLGNNKYIFTSIIIFYYLIIPLILNSSTIGQKFLSIKIVDLEGKTNYQSLILRKLIFILIYVLIPSILLFYISSTSSTFMNSFYKLILCISIIILYLISGIKYLFTNKDMIYEKWSKTKLASTIK